MHTPWGQAQQIKEIGEGILWITTASHGGYYVPPEKVKQMPEHLRNITPWAGKCWYEEGVDWCMVVLAFPHLFPDEKLRADAQKYFNSSYLKKESQPLC